MSVLLLVSRLSSRSNKTREAIVGKGVVEEEPTGVIEKGEEGGGKEGIGEAEERNGKGVS